MYYARDVVLKRAIICFAFVIISSSTNPMIIKRRCDAAAFSKFRNTLYLQFSFANDFGFEKRDLLFAGLKRSSISCEKPRRISYGGSDQMKCAEK